MIEIVGVDALDNSKHCKAKIRIGYGRKFCAHMGEHPIFNVTLPYYLGLLEGMYIRCIRKNDN
jgi:hypothetical protein